MELKKKKNKQIAPKSLEYWKILNKISKNLNFWEVSGFALTEGLQNYWVNLS